MGDFQVGFDEEWGRLRAAAVDAGGRSPAMDPVVQAREAALERLANFRSRTVLVPLDAQGGLWTTALGGLDWICVFSDEEALGRFAEARDEAAQEWTYRRVIGARLLDELVPALDFPCGVAWNAAGPDGVVFPPMRGIVPDAAALDGEAAA
ncbi:hypothetical protein ACFVT6_26005 [Streptomyces sp. NPDC058049]|uniref:hypothetical protein n=1 Tax=Streptomyces sp. NPDC058049 TaxID=3346314 RepID=UPI0036E09C2A